MDGNGMAEAIALWIKFMIGISLAAGIVFGVGLVLIFLFLNP